MTIKTDKSNFNILRNKKSKKIKTIEKVIKKI